MHLQAYFDRIGYRGTARPDLSSMRGILRAHVCSVPFENLDVQFGRPLTTAVDASYEKIVDRGRGGWCYEQNALFGWALTEIGFNVTRMAAAVQRRERGESANANHLSLLVRCPGVPQTWLADVGFGGSMISPIELAEGTHDQAPFRLGLRRLGGNAWRFWEDLGDSEFTYDFVTETADETALSNKCGILQTAPESGFVLNLVIQLRTGNRHLSLRGRVFQAASANGIETELLDSAAQLQGMLAEVFGLQVPEVVDLWPRITARHESLFGAAP
jgi:N-hydroxyarylamine O-acetyltransferase